jgi:hypothetical protein
VTSASKTSIAVDVSAQALAAAELVTEMERAAAPANQAGRQPGP